mgnify:CR=1 FL=1
MEAILPAAFIIYMVIFMKNQAITKKQRLTAAVWAASIGLCWLLAALIAGGKIDAVSLFGVCAFEQSHNLPCPFCGMTRSVCAFASGDVIGSYKMQPAGGVLATTATAFFLYFLLRAFGFALTKITAFLQSLSLLKTAIIAAVIILIGWLITIYNY